MTDQLKRTALHNAAIDGEVREARELLESGADIDARDANGWAPLHFAAQNMDAEMVQLLVESNAYVDTSDEHGNTPLSKAVFNYRDDGTVIELLRKFGADASRQNTSGVSPLSLARTVANYDVAKYFADLPETGAR